MDTISIINKLYNENNASREELLYLLDNIDSKSKELLIEKAHKTRLKYFKNKVYIRGLVELTSFCKKDIAQGTLLYNKFAYKIYKVK